MMSDFIYNFGDLGFVYFVTVAILSGGLIISSLEELSSFAVYSSSGLLSWKVSRYRSSFFLQGASAKIIDFIFADVQFHAILYVRLMLSVLLLITAFLQIVSPVLVILLFGLLLLNLLRSPFGLDGAYQMNIVVLFALSIAAVSGINSPIAKVCVWFIAGELILSYFIAGLAKVISPIWRRSHALPAIFSTKVYGHAGIFELVLRYKIISILLCWPMLAFELLFVFALLSAPLCFFLCVIGISFHLFNAIFMGLNTFFFAFLATYPALFYCCTKMHIW